MTWGLTATTPGQILERGGGGYSYSQQGWQGGGGAGPWSGEGWKGGAANSGGWWKGAATSKSGDVDNSAALSALALLSFLFFLNMLQQQILSSSGQQTLVFMTTGGGGTTGTGNGTVIGRRRRDVEQWGEQDATFQQNELGEDEDSMGADSGAGRRGWGDVRARLRALPPAVAGLLPSCRAVLACSLHIASGPSGLSPRLVTEVLTAGRELRAGVGLDAACTALLADERGQCGPLARSFSEPHLKHDPHDML